MEATASVTPLPNSDPSATDPAAGPNPSATDAADTHAPATTNGDGQSEAARMDRLFKGLDTHHGTYNLDAVWHNGDKLEIKKKGKDGPRGAETVPTPPTFHLWKRHLAGEYPLGISPVRADETSLFGAIDVDDYTVSHRDLAERIVKADLPLILCRSKSGGAHLFLFLRKPMPTPDMRAHLTAMLPILGLPAKTEIFPKSDEPNGSGWINMPYFDGDNGNRYAVGANGSGLSLSRFLKLADEKMTDPETLASLGKALPASAKSEKTTSPSTSEFEQVAADLERRLREATPGRADMTLCAVAREVGRWAVTVTVNLDKIEQQFRSAWKDRKCGDDSEFAQQWGRGVEWGKRKGDPTRMAEFQSVLKTVRLSDVPMKPIEWLWPNRIALGNYAIVSGKPDLGKSQLTIAIAAAVSAGAAWPFGEGIAPKGRVLILSAEDNISTTLRPRFEAADGDGSMVEVVEAILTDKGERSFDLKQDIRRLDRKLSEYDDYKLVLIDPLSAYFGRGTDSHRDTDVRAILAPLSRIAEEHNIAVLGIMHRNKGGGKDAIDSVMGSVGITAAARTAFMVSAERRVVEDKDGNPVMGADKKPMMEETDRRTFTSIKNNIAPNKKDQAFLFDLEGVALSNGIGTSRVRFIEKVSLTANEAIGFHEKAGPGRPAEKREAAKTLLKRLLQDGPELVSDLLKAAELQGIGEQTLKAAKKELGILDEKRTGGRTYWFKPGKQEDMPF